MQDLYTAGVHVAGRPMYSVWTWKRGAQYLRRSGWGPGLHWLKLCEGQAVGIRSSRAVFGRWAGHGGVNRPR